jgi:hypothetical protein
VAYDRIGEFKGLHHGKDVFILASGPSLAGMDLSPLRRRIVMGLNRSSLIYPDTHYHCTMDERLFRQFEDVLRKTRYLFTFEDRPFGIPIRLLGSEGFSGDLEEGIYSGYTVSYFALQVAVYLGFSRVFYLGLDLKHANGQTHFFGNDPVSRNHERTEFPKMIRMLEYGAAQIAGCGVSVYNCSPNTKLTGFERVSFEWALTGSDRPVGSLSES